MVQDILTTSGTSLTILTLWLTGAAPVALLACALDWHRARAGAWRGITDDWRLHLMTMAQGAWRKNGATRVLAALTREWAKFTGPNISVMKTVLAR